MSMHTQTTTVGPSSRHLVEVRWTPACYDRLRAAWADPAIPMADLPRVVGRTHEALIRMARLIGLGKRPAPRAKQAHEWTDTQIAALRELWPDILAVSLATGRTQSACAKKAYGLNLPARTGPRMPSDDVERSKKAMERLKNRMEASPRVARNCLCCGRGFVAPTKFIRMCGPCKGNKE